MSGSTSGRWPPWLDQWGWPFIWILLIPMVTMIWSSLLLDDALDEGICTQVEWGGSFGPEGAAGEGTGGPDIWRCPREDVLPTLLPGLLNLVAFASVLSRRREVRWAGLVAGTLGAARLAAPLLIYGLSGADVEILGPTDTYWLPPSGSESSILASESLWLLSAVSAIVFLVGAKVVESKRRKQAAAGMQARAQDERPQLLARLRDEGLITDEEYENKRVRLARAEGQCTNCGKRLTVDDKMRNRGTALCWECLSGPSKFVQSD